MTALVLLLLITLAATHWLMEPLMHWLPAPLELRWLPWLLLGFGAWLLAGRSEE